jgi:hypothetical protein
MRFQAYTTVHLRPSLFLHVNTVKVGSRLQFQDSLFVPSSNVKQPKKDTENRWLHYYIGHSVGSDWFLGKVKESFRFWKHFSFLPHISVASSHCNNLIGSHTLPENRSLLQPSLL